MKEDGKSPKGAGQARYSYIYVYIINIIYKYV